MLGAKSTAVQKRVRIVAVDDMRVVYNERTDFGGDYSDTTTEIR